MTGIVAGCEALLAGVDDLDRYSEAQAWLDAGYLPDDMPREIRLQGDVLVWLWEDLDKLRAVIAEMRDREVRR